MDVRDFIKSLCLPAVVEGLKGSPFVIKTTPRELCFPFIYGVLVSNAGTDVFALLQGRLLLSRHAGRL